MGFATFDLEAGIAPLWGDVCLHGGQTLRIDLAAAVSPAFARDMIQWDAGDNFVKVRQDKSSAEFSLVENRAQTNARELALKAAELPPVTATSIAAIMRIDFIRSTCL